MLGPLFLAAALAGDAAWAGEISLVSSATATVVDGQLEVELSIRNQGDEAAYSLRPSLHFEQRAVEGEMQPVLAPSETLITALGFTFDRIGPGRWPYRIELNYRDVRGAPFSALLVGTFLVGSEPLDELALELLELPPLADTTTLRARVRNLVEQPRTARLEVHLPEGVEAKSQPLLTLGGSGERIVEVELANRGAAPGGRLAVFLTLDHASGGVHRSLVTAGTLETLRPASAPGERTRWGWAVAIGFAVALTALLTTGLHRRWRSRAADGESASGGASPWQDLVDLGAVAASVGFVALYFPPSLLLSVTTTNGGDMASHVYTAAYLREVLLPRGRLLGWCPGNFGGFPFLQFYFPLTFLLMAALSLAMPLEVAFKLVTVLGSLLLPACAYLGLRLLGSPFPGPALGALGSLCFLFMEANSMWGGNLPSTLAGEFTFSLGLALAVLFVGTLRWAMRHRRGLVGNAVLVALIGFSHGYALLWAGLVSLLELVTTRAWWRRLRSLIVVHGLAVLLMAFWLLQLLWYTPWTTAFNPVWNIRSWHEILPPILWPAALVGLIASLVTGAISWRRRETFPRTLGTLWGAVVLSLFFYLTAHSFHVVDIRFMPFFQLSICLLAAAGVAELARRLPAPWVWPLLGVVLVLPFVRSQVAFIPSWIEWNYSGFEQKAAWPIFRDINAHLVGDVADPRVAWEHSPAHEQFGTTRAFESLPLFSGRSTLEGVYMQAAVTAPFVFYIQSEISKLTSCPFPEWGCGRLDLERARHHLRMFNVSQLILNSSEAKEAAAAHPGLEIEAAFGDYEVHRLVDADGAYALSLDALPVLIRTREWKPAAYQWFRRSRPGGPLPVFATRATESEEARFAAVFDELPDRLPQVELSAAPALEEEVGEERIILRGCRPGQPVLIRVTYHPRWRAVTGERVWLAGPGLMLVFPRGERVELEFADGPVLIVGRLASAAGLGVLLLAWLPVGRRLRRWGGRAVDRAGRRSPLGRAVEWARRSAEWPARTRRRVLAAGVGLVVILLTGFALFNVRPDADSTYRRAQRRFDGGHLEEAAELFRQASELAPLSMTAIHARYFEAISYYKMGSWREAEARFESLVREFPEALNVAESLWHVGLCRERLGDLGGAAVAWERVVAEFPQSEWAGYARQRLAAAAGRDEAAMDGGQDGRQR